MTVTEIWLDQHVAWDSFASLMRPEPRDEDKSEEFAAPNSFEPLYLVASLCNNARVSEVSMDVDEDARLRRSRSQSGDMNTSLPRRHPSMARQLEYFGNPSEVALLRFCNGLRSVQSIRNKYRVAFEIPFNSAHKYHLVVVADVSTTTIDGKCQYNTLMKGAPELIVQRCTHYMLKVRQTRRCWPMDVSGRGAVCAIITQITISLLLVHIGRDLFRSAHVHMYPAPRLVPQQGKLQPVNEGFQQDYSEAYKRFASRGRRVLGFAYKPFWAAANTPFTAEDDDINFPNQGLVFLGLTAIMDPPREGVRDAILRCHTASIKVFMVTGDHALTACAIARQVCFALPLPGKAGSASSSLIPALPDHAPGPYGLPL